MIPQLQIWVTLTILCSNLNIKMLYHQVTIVQAKESAEGVQVTQEVHSANTGNGIDDGISEVPCTD